MKKLTTRIWTVALAVVMVLAMTVTAMAAGTGTITIYPPAGTDANATTTYNVYKVFDADGNGTSISYKLMSNKGTDLAGNMAIYFEVDSAGNVIVKDAAIDAQGDLTAGAIDAIAKYVQGDSPVATITAKGTNLGTAEGLANGFYYVSTTTGMVAIVTSTNPIVDVEDKNTVPTVATKITSVKAGEVVAGSVDTDGKKALAELGSIVTYQTTVTFGKGSKNVKFHEKMGTGLSYSGTTSVEGINADEFTIETTPDEGDTLTISFKDGIAESTVATITYTATVNSDALTTNAPAKNTATVSYGDNGATSTPSVTNVYNAKFTVTATDGNNQPLAGAGFVIKKQDAENSRKYKYYQKNGNDVNWVDSIDQATELTTTASSNVIAFTGLANGYYTLVENTVPSGYNKAADSTFSVTEHDYNTTNLEQSPTVVNNAGSLLPSTGGIGTTMFYIIGAILVLGAGVLLVTRKRMSAK